MGVFEPVCVLKPGLRTYRTLEKRDAFGDLDDDCAGDFVVPGLFVAIPAGPEEAEEENDERETSGEAANQRDGEINGRAVGANNFQAKTNFANARAFPGPHADEIGDQDEWKQAGYNEMAERDWNKEQNPIEKGGESAFPETDALQEDGSVRKSGCGGDGRA